MKYLIIIFVSVFIISCGGNSSSDKSDGGIIMDNVNEKTGIIASIKEASGVCYVAKTDTLFVVGDNGFVYELSRNGEELNKKSFSGRKNHDFEGISYDDKTDSIFVAVEGSDNLMVLNRDLVFLKEINIERQDNNGVDVLEKGGEGIEGISINNGVAYVSNQSFERYPTPDSSSIVKLDSISGYDSSIDEVINHGYNNISGMAFYKNFLYLVSDTGDLLIKYDVANNKVISDQKVKKIDSTLTKISLEGVAFDNKGYIYFAIDDKENGKIVKYPYDK